ncbi:unnamed protein product [Parnassius apollo]|uniref:(apollo) hypothetical protein n=1 Tax=Parnassius apollo TaxID=110799 RepID=A0A8S3XPF3_PARAO|nr:unnamed protein product [Parnassius apollo]
MKLIDIAKDLPRNTSAANRIDTAHRYYTSVENNDTHDKMADTQVFHACARLYDVMFTAPRILAQLGNLEDLTPRLLTKHLMEMQIKPVHLGVALLIQGSTVAVQNSANPALYLDVGKTKVKNLTGIQQKKKEDAGKPYTSSKVKTTTSSSPPPPPTFASVLDASNINIHLDATLETADTVEQENQEEWIQYHLRNTINFAIRSKMLEVLSTKPQEVGPNVIDMLKVLASRLLPVAELLDIHLAHSSPAFKDTCPSTWLGIVDNKQP